MKLPSPRHSAGGGPGGDAGAGAGDPRPGFGAGAGGDKGWRPRATKVNLCGKAKGTLNKPPSFAKIYGLSRHVFRNNRVTKYQKVGENKLQHVITRVGW